MSPSLKILPTDIAGAVQNFGMFSTCRIPSVLRVPLRNICHLRFYGLGSTKTLKSIQDASLNTSYRNFISCSRLTGYPHITYHSDLRSYILAPSLRTDTREYGTKTRQHETIDFEDLNKDRLKSDVLMFQHRNGLECFFYNIIAASLLFASCYYCYQVLVHMELGVTAEKREGAEFVPMIQRFDKTPYRIYIAAAILAIGEYLRSIVCIVL